MKNRFYTYPLLVCSFLLVGASAVALADTIRLKDGTVIRGQIIGFRDQQFTVLMGTSERGRRSRVTLYMEDVDSIEFDAANNSSAAGATGDTTPAPATNTATARPATQPPTSSTTTTTTTTTAPPPSSSRPNTPPTTTTTSAGQSTFFPVTVRVRADNSTNGWTNSGLVVRRGQRLRITASGRVSLGAGRFSTPAGIATLADRGKLMQTEPTGALIAVIGDDNDDFIAVGARRDFVAQRDGVLFLGVNEGELTDNTGAYDVTIEAEAASRASR